MFRQLPKLGKSGRLCLKNWFEGVNSRKEKIDAMFLKFVTLSRNNDVDGGVVKQKVTPRFNSRSIGNERADGSLSFSLDTDNFSNRFFRPRCRKKPQSVARACPPFLFLEPDRIENTEKCYRK